jgi:RNA polymerase sigma-70 factor (ECF subfamily)
VQIVLIKIFKSLDQFSAKVPFKHWVSRVTVNTCLNAIRHEKRRPEVRMADLSEDEEAVVLALAATAAELSPDAQLCARDLIQRLVACLKTEERFLIRLIYLEGFTIEEASQITSWGVGAVSMRLSRARAKMRERYESLFNEIKSKHESI